ncbi:hypothetical protein PVAP13_4NG155181 [Panicum virgatum]|uniref:Uncharacterized protein n=1 Tax=Panicum virgatum TaxID=38727 RepID=A0A8T0T3V2_PANVG|nr:hypothetical protein PVAP13_4NG155181 [Panicum virgatum]
MGIMKDWVTSKMAAYLVIRPKSAWWEQPSLVCDSDCKSPDQHQIFAPFLLSSLFKLDASFVIHGWMLALGKPKGVHLFQDIVHLVFCKCQNHNQNHDINRHCNNDKDDVHRCRNFPAASGSKSTHEADQINQNTSVKCIALKTLAT